MNRLPRIAILADYPAWTVLDNQAPESWHYTVWLTALSQAFSQQEEWEIHWVTLARYVGKAQHVKKMVSISMCYQEGAARWDSILPILESGLI